MPKKKRTILKHEDPSKENWKGNRLLRHLKSRVKARGLGMEYKTKKMGRGRVGLTETESGDKKKSKRLGISWKKRF